MATTSVGTLGLKNAMRTKSSAWGGVYDFNLKNREKVAPNPLKNPLNKNAVNAIVADQPHMLVIACMFSFSKIIASSVAKPMPIAVLIRMGHSIERMVFALVKRVRINRLQSAVPKGQMMTLRLYP